MPDSFQHIQAAVNRGVVVLTLSVKELQDYDVAKEVESEFVKAYTDAGLSNVIVDVGQLEFLASVGFWPFVGLYHKVKESGGRMVLCNLSEFVENMLMRTQMLINPHAERALFLKADSVDDAVELLSGGE